MLRIGWGYDIHRLEEGFPLVLGGVDFPASPKGFNTHSDGDVVAHAIIDALCGAMADGSLGDYFPEDDPNDQDARSIEFLQRFLPVLQRHRATVINLDCTIFAIHVRVGPVAPQMKQNIASHLGIPPGVVSIKGKTKDYLGSEGRGEAISAVVVALVEVGDAGA
jgi:2-C-methyl-D-erythritol 2,4-cyclodiphosphate synthase